MTGTRKEKRNKAQRLSKKAQCIRRTTTTSPIPRKVFIDKPGFISSAYTRLQSGKFTSLIDKIRSLDLKDISDNGTKYKHLIFTDIRESSYGAKALAGYLMSAGFDFRMGLKRKYIKRKGVEVETKTGETIYLESEPIPGGSERFVILQSVPLWKNPLSVSTKKQILSVFNSRPDNIHGEHIRLIVLDSKFKEGIDLFDVRYVHILEPPIATSDLKQAVGRATRFCGQKGLRFIPNKGWPLDVFTYNVELPGRYPFTTETNIQKVDAHKLMLEYSGLDLALLKLTEELTRLAIISAVDYDLCYNINNFKIAEDLIDAVEAVVIVDQNGGATSLPINAITPQIIELCGRRKSKLFPFSRLEILDTAKSIGIKINTKSTRTEACKLLQNHPELLTKLLSSPIRRQQNIDSAKVEAAHSIQSYFPTPRTIAETPYSAIAPLFATPEKSGQTLQSIANLPFSEFQDGIINLYSQFGWSAPIVKSGCDTQVSTTYGRPVTFTKTQDFIRHYLTPQSPFKGLLTWHSVGTGKTCMAVATATSSFEQAGYTILWVTRNALMADVYKNIFGSVCSIPLMNAIDDSGLIIPEDKTNAKKLLSRQWFAPITYRMLQNALKKQNALGRLLYERNPSDPLAKTFLIIDEIHKLQDGDLSPAESADFSFIQTAIWKSYEISGSESVRPLLMTATPIADKPGELFEILNTLIPTPQKRLMNINDFRTKFTDDEGKISQEGREYFQDRVKGLISYLNREFDPTTFAQPHFHTINVPVGAIDIPTIDNVVRNTLSDKIFENVEEPNCEYIDEELEKELSALPPKVPKKIINEIRNTYKAKMNDCKAMKKTYQRTLKNNLSKLLKEGSQYYRKMKKEFKDNYDKTQIVFVEKCLDKQKKIDLPSLQDVKSALSAAFYEQVVPKAESISSIEAVRMTD